MAKPCHPPQAADDLEEICRYISRDSVQYARLFAQSVMRILKSMSRERMPGSMVPEYGVEEIREKLLHSYRIIVRVREQSSVLEVVRIIHGARLLPPMDE